MLAGAPARTTLLVASALALAACKEPTALELQVVAPSQALLNPFTLSVSDYVLKTEDGSTLAAVSAGAKAASDGLPLGALAPTLAGTLRLDVLSGLELVGLAYIDDVAIKKGKTEKVDAQVRKPLVVVGSEQTAEQPSSALSAAQLLDPTTSSDLVAQGLSVPAAPAASFTRDGQKLLLGTKAGLTIFDTGSGMQSGPSALAFAPALIAVAPGDKGVAFVERGTASSRVAWYTDEGSLLANGAGATAVSAMITTGVPRVAHFSPDGSTLYVLTETAGSEPCTGSTAPQANEILPITIDGADGKIGTPISLRTYVADFAVEQDGTLLLAESANNQLVAISPSDSTGQANKLYDATCPTAVRVLGSDVYAVTNDTNGTKTTFSLMHGHTDGSMASHLGIALPEYATTLTTQSSPNAMPTLSFTADAIVATEMAVSLDGSRAVLATRARYTRTASQTFDVLGLTCVPGLDVVEYGLYSVDLDAGSASYTMRSQAVVTSNADMMGDCVSCSEDLGIDGTLVFVLGCNSSTGDRAAGLSAAFSEGP